MTNSPNPSRPPTHLSPQELAEQLQQGAVRVIDVREPLEVASGRIAGSANVPLAHLSQATLPQAPLVLVCQSGNRSARGVRLLQERGHPYPVMDLAGGISGWQSAGLPLQRIRNAPLPLMRQVQISAGSLVLLGLILSSTVAPAWILLSWAVGLGLVVSGVSGSCAMASMLARMPWNRMQT